MSLAIDALRLAVVEALRADPVIASIVEGRVLDSRIEAYSDDEPTPVISVYTEEDEGEAWSANNGGPPFQTTVDLVLEIMVQIGEAAANGQPALTIAVTDRETEALLGLLRSRAEEVIAVGEGPWSIMLRNHCIRRVLSTSSKRYRSDDIATRAALRLVTLKVEVKNPDDDEPASGPFAALPQPLRSVCEAMPQGSSGLITCQLLAGHMANASANEQPFEGMDMVIRPGPQPRPTPTDNAEFAARAEAAQD